MTRSLCGSLHDQVVKDMTSYLGSLRSLQSLQLTCWGFSSVWVGLLPLQLCDQHVAVVDTVVDADPALAGPVGNSFVFFWEKSTAETVWFETTSSFLQSELNFMTMFGNLGQSRSAILDTHQLSDTIWVIIYANVAQASDVTEDIAWHTEQPLVTKPRLPETFADILAKAPANCVLRPSCDLVAIRQIFGSHDFLHTSFEGIELPTSCFCSNQQKVFDRLRIYPAYLHWEPDLVLREGKPDAWAFVVVGECINPDQSSTFTFVGNATQPACYERHPQFAGLKGLARTSLSERPYSGVVSGGWLTMITFRLSFYLILSVVAGSWSQVDPWNLSSSFCSSARR